MRSIAITFGTTTLIVFLTLVQCVWAQSVVPHAAGVDQFGHAVEPEITVVAADASARPGQTIQLVVHVRTKAGLHLLPARPDDRYLIPTSLVIEGTRNLALVGTEWPAAIRLSGQPTRVMPAEFDVRVIVQVATEVSSDSVVAAMRVRFQQCDAHGCYIPQSMRVPIVVPIAGAGL